MKTIVDWKKEAQVYRRRFTSPRKRIDLHRDKPRLCIAAEVAKDLTILTDEPRSVNNAVQPQNRIGDLFLFAGGEKLLWLLVFLSFEIDLNQSNIICFDSSSSFETFVEVLSENQIETSLLVIQYTMINKQERKRVQEDEGKIRSLAFSFFVTSPLITLFACSSNALYEHRQQLRRFRYEFAVTLERTEVVSIYNYNDKTRSLSDLHNGRW